MGLYNGDFANPSEGTQRPKSEQRSVVNSLVALTIGVYVLQMLTAGNGTGDSTVFQWLALERDLVFESGQIWRLLTYAFCHSESHISHIAFNMLALFFTGRIVARKLGNVEFLCLYLTSAVFAGVVQVCSMAIFRSPGPAWALGASGAVCAVFMLFAMYYPKMKLYFFGVVPVQARWLLLALVTYDSLGFLGMAPRILSGDGASVGHAAHLGGLAFGFLYFQGSMNISSWWNRMAERSAPTVAAPQSPGLRVFNPGTQPQVTYTDRVDEVLDKISREGKDSLTARELRILDQASEHLAGNR